MKEELQDKPVVLIGVVSGQSKADVERYVKETEFQWPVLVDEQRATEKAFGVSKIGLQNIYQWVIVDPEGASRVTGPDAKTAEKAIQDLLPRAKNVFDGIALPEALKPLARQLEMGIYDATICELITHSKKGPKDVRESAQAMYKKLEPLAAEAIDRARAAGGWAAYKEYESVQAWFRGSEHEKTATAALAALRKDKEVKAELAARTSFDQARALLDSSDKAEQAQGKTLLRQCAKRHPDTEAGQKAAKLAER